jgi:hypothetical protein
MARVPVLCVVEADELFFVGHAAQPRRFGMCVDATGLAGLIHHVN